MYVDLHLGDTWLERIEIGRERSRKLEEEERKGVFQRNEVHLFMNKIVMNVFKGQNCTKLFVL